MKHGMIWIYNSVFPNLIRVFPKQIEIKWKCYLWDEITDIVSIFYFLTTGSGLNDLLLFFMTVTTPWKSSTSTHNLILNILSYFLYRAHVPTCTFYYNFPDTHRAEPSSDIYCNNHIFTIKLHFHIAVWLRQ